MLKKITILIITCLFAMTALAGCSIIAEQNEKTLIENALQERYGEEFVCMRTWNNDADGYYSHSFYGLCYPKGDENLLFEVLISADGNLRDDDYISVTASKIICEIFNEYVGNRLGKYYIHCRNYGDLDDVSTASFKMPNNEFTFEYFLSENIKVWDTNQLELYFTICFDNSNNTEALYKTEYSVLVDALNHICQIGKQNETDFHLNMKLFYVSNDTYEECVRYFQENAYVDSNFYNIIEKNTPNNEPQCMIKMNYKNGEFSITQENYIQKRKEIDNNVW